MRFEGWPIVGVTTVAISAMCLLLLGIAGFDADGMRLVIRGTARTSVVLFGAAFMASSLVMLWPHPLTKWGLRNRRYLGVAFGASHGIHYLAVLAFLLLAPDIFQTDNGTLGIEKLFPIVLLTLLVGTSFDRTAALLGRRGWKILHWTGSYIFWLLFLLSFGGRAMGSFFYSGFTAFLIVMVLVRLGASGRQILRRRRSG